MKKLLAFCSLAIFLVAGVYAAVSMSSLPRTYDGSGSSVTELYSDPEAYDVSQPDGVGDIIVQEDLSHTKAVNVVTAIVFDFRGYDTMGEAFILVTAISGSMVILRKAMKKEGGK